MDNGVWTVATINLPGLPLGQRAYVDPENPYIAMCLEGGYLRREATTGDVTNASEEPVVEDGGETAVPDPVGDAVSDG